MRQHFQIVVADNELEVLDYYHKTLSNLEHQVVGAAEDGEELIHKCRAKRPDLVITEIELPKTNGIDAAAVLRDEMPLPVILVSSCHEPELIDQALGSQAMNYLIKPIKQANLEAAIPLAMRRIKELQLLRRQLDDAHQALKDRKTVERAKGIIMSRTELGEQDAFRRLQLLSSVKNRKMVDVARMIVTAEEAIQV